MKIFILGTEGAGKTVLLAMLSRHVAEKRKDLVLTPADDAAEQYLINTLVALDKEDWPQGTTPAKVETLTWNFGSRGKPLHEIVLFDAAGQDLQKILKLNNPNGLTKELQSIRTQIDAANILVYLLDLNGFLKSKDLSVIAENAWLFKTFLTRPEWRGKRRLVVLSKADIYTHMLAALPNQDSEDAKVRELVKQHLPKNYTLGHLVDAESTVNYFAITSVVTTTRIDPAGNPERRPKKPLRSVGMDNLADAFLEEASSITRRKEEDKRKNEAEDFWRRVRGGCGFFLVAFILSMLLWGLFHPVICTQCGGAGGGTCIECRGTGTIEDAFLWIDEKCNVCKGTGGPCNKCKQSGKVPWWKS